VSATPSLAWERLGSALARAAPRSKPAVVPAYLIAAMTGLFGAGTVIDDQSSWMGRPDAGTQGTSGRAAVLRPAGRCRVWGGRPRAAARCLGRSASAAMRESAPGVSIVPVRGLLAW